MNQLNLTWPTSLIQNHYRETCDLDQWMIMKPNDHAMTLPKWIVKPGSMDLKHTLTHYGNNEWTLDQMMTKRDNGFKLIRSNWTNDNMQWNMNVSMPLGQSQGLED